jgi:PhoH-like ATPase
MHKSILIDTNLLLDDPKIIFKLSKEHEKIIIPITVLKELDKHKANPDLAYSARSAIHEIREFKDNHPDKLTLYVNEDDVSTSDLKIIRAAMDNNAKLATKDISMSLVAEAADVDCELYGVVREGLSDPYVKIKISTIVDDFEYKQNYYDIAYYDTIALFSKACGKNLDINSWFFVFIVDDEDYDLCLYAHNPLNFEFKRIDNISSYRGIPTIGGELEALDWYQICAIYALREAPNVLLTGKWGSGKTLLATANALDTNKRKIFITRPPVGINRHYDIGYLPGNKEDKMADWFAGFISALYYMYSNTRDQKDGNGGTFDFVKEEIFKKKFETVPINAIQGMSILEGDTLMVDEIQLVDVDYLSMILSRSSEGSNMVLMGDLSQTYNVVRPSESGLLKLLRALPHRSMCHVNLKNSYRGELVELADQLQDKTF